MMPTGWPVWHRAVTAVVVRSAQPDPSRSFLAVHLSHILVFGVPTLFLAVAVGSEWIKVARQEQRQITAPSWALNALALLWLGSACVHIGVIRQHFAESVVLGVFFVGLSLVQVAYAALLLRAPSRPLLVYGLVVNVAVIALWSYTRIVDIPFGIGPRESVGIADSLAVAYEALAAVVSGALLYLPLTTGRVRVSPRWAALASLVAVASIGLAAATGS